MARIVVILLLPLMQQAREIKASPADIADSATNHFSALRQASLLLRTPAMKAVTLIYKLCSTGVSLIWFLFGRCPYVLEGYHIIGEALYFSLRLKAVLTCLKQDSTVTQNFIWSVYFCVQFVTLLHPIKMGRRIVK